MFHQHVHWVLLAYEAHKVWILPFERSFHSMYLWDWFKNISLTLPFSYRNLISFNSPYLIGVCRYISGNCHVGSWWLSTHTHTHTNARFQPFHYFFFPFPFDTLLWQHRRWYLRISVNTCTCMCGLGFYVIVGLTTAPHSFVHSFAASASRRRALRDTQP